MKIQTHQRNIGITAIGLGLALCCVFAAIQSRAGAVLKLYYDPIPGLAVSNLTSAAIFPDSPVDRTVTVDLLENPANFGNDYGTFTRGYIEAPQTGQYTFWVASDDDAEFWLSTSSATNGLVKVCENVGAVAPRAFNAKPAQKSALISLVRGEKYYFELLHKEAGGADHVAVGWQLPDGTLERPISGVRLMPFPVTETLEARQTAPLFLTDYFGAIVPALADTFVDEGKSVTLAATIEATQPAVLQWYRAGVALTGENLSTLSFASASLADNGVQFSLVASNSLGAETNSLTLFVTADTTAPSLVSALKRSDTQVSVVFSEPVNVATATTAANYTLDNGATVSAATMGAKPNIVLLTTSSLVPGTPYILTANNVQDLAATPNAISFGTIPLEQNLKLWLKFDETTGTLASDSSGNGLNATLVGGPKVNVSGKANAALRLDGVDDHADLPDGFDDFTGGMTLSVWARPSATAFWARFIEFGNGPGQNNIIFAREGGSSTLALGVPGDAAFAPSTIENGVWQHLAAALDPSGTVVLYKNGIPVFTRTLPVPSIVTRTNNYVGRSNWPPPDANYAGKMDDVRVYTRALSAAEIEALAATDPSATIVEATTVDAEAGEEGSATGAVQFTRSGSTSAALTVSYFVEGTATSGDDYAALSGTVIIPTGTNSATVIITPVDDAVLDQSETVVLNLGGSVEYIGGISESATVTILDNEDSVPPQLLYATVDREINLWFSEPLNLASVTNTANYTINGSAATVTSATTFGATKSGIALTLSAPITESGVTIAVANVQDVGGNSMIPGNVPVQKLLPNPVNIVQTVYQGISRATAFGIVANGIVATDDRTQTFDGFNVQNTDFTGLIYANPQQFTALKVDLGRQFGDGGNWRIQPRIYILKNGGHIHGVDAVPPQNEPDNWREVPGVLVSANAFDVAGDALGAPTNTPIVFDLTAVPVDQRTGYGWAVGGVNGDGSASFITISELRAYGIAGTDSPVTIVAQPQDRTVTEGQRATFSVAATGTLPITYQWQRNESDIPGAVDSAYTTPPAQLFENTDRFRVIVSNPLGPVTSSNAVLTVNADTNSPIVVAATLDATIDVWFNEVVSATATTLANYGLSDGSVTITNAIQDASGRRVTLSLSGAITQSNPTLAVSGVQDNLGQTMAPQNVPLHGLLSAAGVVANNYNSAIPAGRAGTFAMSVDGIVDNLSNGGGWDSYGSSGNLSDFVGLISPSQSIHNFIKVDLGNQFFDGGSWSAQPKVYLLKNPVDTDRARPEFNTNWVEVAATLVSDSLFDNVVDPSPSPNTPIGFDLSQLPLTNRVAYGWAVGGVPGDGSMSFLSITELRSYGVNVASLSKLNASISGNNIVISWSASAEGFVLQSRDNFEGATWQNVPNTPDIVNGQKVVTLSINGDRKFFRLFQ